MRYVTLWNDPQFANPWKLVNQLFDDGELQSRGQGFEPAAELDETESGYIMSFDLPGVSKKEIKIEVKDRELLVSGERKSERKSQNSTERYYGKFSRSIELPPDADTQHVEAQYQDGVLRVAFQKEESAKPREIQIAEGKTSLFGKLLGGRETEKKEVRTSPEKAA